MLNTLKIGLVTIAVTLLSMTAHAQEKAIQSNDETVTVAKVSPKTIRKVVKEVFTSKKDPGVYAGDPTGIQQKVDENNAAVNADIKANKRQQFFNEQQEAVKKAAKQKSSPKSSNKSSTPDPKERNRVDKDFKDWQVRGRFKPGGCRGC